MNRSIGPRVAAAALSFVLFVAASATAQSSVFPEVEPNGSKADAITNGAYVLAAGVGISGVISSSADADFFHVQTPPESGPGVYRYELHLPPISSMNTPIIHLWGFTQTTAPSPCGPDSDAIVQFEFGFVAWYGTGGPTNVIVSVSDVGPTSYVLTLSKQTVETTPLGTFPGGVPLAVATSADIGAPDMDAWIFDSGFAPLPNAGSTFQPAPFANSPIVATPPLGRCYLAVALKDLNLSICSPSAKGKLLDFPATYASNGMESNAFEIAIGELGGATRFFDASFAGDIRYTVKWYSFDVGDPTLMTLSITQPGGPGSLMIFKNVGPPNTPYLMAATLTTGNYPNGWFFGIDIPIDELVLEIAIGAPFIGTTGPTGEHVDIFGVVPGLGGVPIRVVVRRLDLAAEPPTPAEYIIL